MDTSDLPEKTTYEIREKINCYQADNMMLKEKVRELEMQQLINNTHIQTLFGKLKESILDMDSRLKKVKARK
jgi:hypothetical protein